MEENTLSLERECRFLESNLCLIAERYGSDTYIAISGANILDNDPNMFDLTVRMSKKYGDKPILITSINEYATFQLSGKT